MINLKTFRSIREWNKRFWEKTQNTFKWKLEEAANESNKTYRKKIKDATNKDNRQMHCTNMRLQVGEDTIIQRRASNKKFKQDERSNNSNDTFMSL